METWKIKKRLSLSLSPNSDTSGMSLMPMVDILFAAVGIFVLVTALNIITKQKGSLPPAPPDAVILCNNNVSLTYISPDELAGLTFTSDDLDVFLLEQLKNRIKPIYIVIAFNSFGIESYHKVVSLIEKIKLNQNSNNKLASIVSMRWPLNDEPSSVPDIVELWRNIKHGTNE